jgi:hypothetical protein
MSLCVLLRFQCRTSDEASEAGRPWIGCPKETLNVLEESLIEGAAEFTAELISGDVAYPYFKAMTEGHEKEIEAAFAADEDKA